MTRNRKKKGDNSYSKTAIIFQCEKRHTWHSVHGWVEAFALNLKCDQCNGNTRVTSMEPEIPLWLGHCKICDGSWHVLLENESELRIPCCGKPIDYQKIACNYYDHKCNKCGQEWSDATTGEQYTQWCKICNNRGEFIGKKRFTKEDIERLKSKKRTGNGLGHDPTLCDMCQLLRRNNATDSCTKVKEVGTRKAGLNSNENDQPLTTMVTYIVPDDRNSATVFVNPSFIP